MTHKFLQAALFGAAFLVFAGPCLAAPLTLAVAPAPATPTDPMTTQGLMSIVEIGRMSADGLSVSPDGKRYAIMTHQARPASNSYETAWFVGQVRGGQPASRIGDGGEADLFRNVQGGWGNENAQWSPDSQRLYYRKKVDGAVQVWVTALAGARSRRVTARAGDATDFALSPDGKTLYFTTDMARAEIAALDAAAYRAGYQADEKNFALLYQTHPYHRPYDRQAGKPTYWALDLASGAAHAASADEEARFEALRSGPPLLRGLHAKNVQQGQGAYKLAWLDVIDPKVNIGLDPPRRIAASKSVDGSNPVICPDMVCSAPYQNNFGFDAAGEVVFDNLDKGVRRLYAWRPGSSKARLISNIEANLSDCSLDRDEAICLLEAPTWPTRVAAIDLRTGAQRIIAEPNPDFGHWKLGQVRRMDWTSAHGVPTWGYLIYPVDYQPGRRYPLVFVQYSQDDCLRGGTGDEFPSNVFSAHGMMVICTNGAHPASSLGATEPNPYKLFAHDYEGFRREIEVLSSYEEIIHQLDREGLVDPKRVGITGLSHGAEAVQYALVHSKAFAAAAMASTSDEFTYFGSNPNIIGVQLRPIGFGDPYKPSENFGYKDFSLSTNVEHIDTPLMVQAPDREYLSVVPVFRRWRDAGKSMDLYVFDDEYHVKWQPAHRLAVYDRYVDWFDFWLNDRENDRAAKPEQYARWEGFRAKECAMPNAAEKAYCAAAK
jgi:dipeptidyl aminopeptidase/acylaminoacyl peptidase